MINNAKIEYDRLFNMKDKKVGYDEVLPSAIDVEEAVLGAILLEKDALAKIIDILKPEVFYSFKHKKIYETILSLFQDSEPIDIITVIYKLRSLGILEECGGAFYINQLISQIASTANIEHHAHIILQKYIQREIITIANNLGSLAYNDSNDIFEIISTTENILHELSDNNKKKDSISIETLTIKTLQHLEQLKNKGQGITGVTTGFRKLDEMTSGWQPSDLIILAARPSMGKTAFMLSLARNAAIKANKAIALFSLEMSSIQLVQRLICSEAELDAQRVRTGILQESEWIQLNNRIGNISKAPIYIDDTAGLSINDLRVKCRRLKQDKNIELIVIDYLQLMRADHMKGRTREQEIAYISRSLKELAKELNVAVIALSQLSRTVESRGNNKRPMLSDLRESGSIEQDADVVMFLYRPEYYGLVIDEEGNSTAGMAEVIIGKHRNGPVGIVKVDFINQFAKFQDMGQGSAYGTNYSNPNISYTENNYKDLHNINLEEPISITTKESNVIDIEEVPF